MCIRDRSLSTDYFIVFSSFGDSLNIRHLNSAFFDGNEKKLQKCFDLLSKSYKERFKVYILIDISNKSPFPDQLRIRSDIFNYSYPVFFL